MTTDAIADRLPTEQESKSASEAVTVMAKALAQADDLVLTVQSGSEGVNIQLPRSLGYSIVELLSHIGQGETVTLVPYGAELSTQAAADLLNVSRPHLISLLEKGEIHFHHVGSHRRIKAVDLYKYKDERDKRRAEGMKELQKLGQEFDAS